MTTKYRQVDLEWEAAYEYIYSTLEAGGGLSKAILNELSPKTHKISTRIPEEKPLDNINLRESISKKYSVGEIVDHVQHMTNKCIIVVDDVMASEKDISPDLSSLCTTINGDIYYLFNKETDTEKIEKIFNATHTPWHQLCAIILPPRDSQSAASTLSSYINKGSLSETKLIEAIILSFDGEGYIHITPKE